VYKNIIDYIDSHSSTIKKTNTVKHNIDIKNISEHLNIMNNNDQELLSKNQSKITATPNDINLKKKKREVVWL